MGKKQTSKDEAPVEETTNEPLAPEEQVVKDKEVGVAAVEQAKKEAVAEPVEAEVTETEDSLESRNAAVEAGQAAAKANAAAEAKANK